MSEMASTDEVKAGLSQDVDAGDVAQRIGDRVGVRARVSAVFGDPVEQAGVTVIPVAKARWGFGGGSGGEGENQGSGGGGGALVSPIGFIEVRQGEARFVPIRDLRTTALQLAAATCLLGWMMRGRR
jgi:uncharacterized spore protein YtfJ